MDTNAFVAVRRAEQGECCQRCGSVNDVAALVLVEDVETPGHPTSALRVCVCSLCAAELVQVATGFKAQQQLIYWYSVRALAAASRVRKSGAKLS